MTSHEYYGSASETEKTRQGPICGLRCVNLTLMCHDKRGISYISST
jgi:hypothetical protein